jgi:endo-beta-N-acetylglucosaminidase D
MPIAGRSKIILPAAFLILAVAGLVPADAAPPLVATLPSDQPYASYWHPGDLLSWSPETDPDAPYNRSHTPLRDRFLNDAVQVNPHARPHEAGIAALDIFWATSGNPSQGALDVNYFAFNYWQYLERLVFWGGSASEGLILAPNPGVIDAAHRNGVPVLGTIFFPPIVYGGQIQWVRDLLQNDGSTFPVADKLIEVAEYYGFDGYFINQETAGGDATLAADMVAFMKYFQAHSDLQLMWYDAMTESGAIAWQSRLDSVNDAFFQDGADLTSESMFLDFGWGPADLTSSRTYAQSLGRSEYELYAGEDTQASGYGSFVNWGVVFPEGQPHVTSLAFYVPSWTYHSSSGLLDFYARANRFWVGANRDPSYTTTTSTWKGLAHYIPDQSVVNDVPFVTNFCTGQGYDFYLNGQRLSPSSWSSHGWNNIGLQDILPSWRWIVETTGTPLYPEMDWSDAWYGGNCIKVSGTLDADNLVKLYQTDLPVTATTEAKIAFRRGVAGPSNMQLGLAFASDPATFVFHDVGTGASPGWNLATIDLGAHAGERIAVIALKFLSTGGSYTMKIGRIGIVDSAADAAPAPPSGLRVERRVDEAGYTTFRLRWNHSPSPVDYYNVYYRRPDSSLVWIGATPNNAWFAPEVTRDGDSLAVIEVEALGPDFTPSSHATLVFPWDGATSVEDASMGSGAAVGLALHVNEPNPFGPATTIRYDLSRGSDVSLRVFDVEGRAVRALVSEWKDAGGQTITWDGRDEAGELLPGGIYFVRLRAGDREITRKAILLR